MDDGSGKPPLIQLIILLCLSAYLSFAETAFASVSKNKIKVAADRGDGRAIKALWILNHFDRVITTILICNNITNLSIATIVTVFVTKKWGLSFVSLSTIITTTIVFFACEMLPKAAAKRYSYKTTLSCASFFRFLMFILKPFAFALAFIGEKAAKHAKADDEISVTEDEIQDIIEDMTEEGTLDENQSELITCALQFGDITAQNILTPRVNIEAIDVDDKPENILEFVKNQTHSRIPVYQNSIDNIIGVLGIRKYMKSYIRRGKIPNIRTLVDKVHYVHANTEIQKILPLMSKHRINMAVVKDEYGGTLGIITVEDILEELVGDIWDESDVIKQIQKRDKTEYLDEAVTNEILAGEAVTQNRKASEAASSEVQTKNSEAKKSEKVAASQLEESDTFDKSPQSEAEK